MKLWAVSDLHVGYKDNLEALEALPARPRDWLILGGDVCEHAHQLRHVLRVLRGRFAQLAWVPGNHELWTSPHQPDEPRGQAKYEQLLEVCRQEGALTPEDAYVAWPGAGPRHLLALCFTLYDYSFRPADVSAEDALAWAAETRIVCADEALLSPEPWASRSAWCAARCDLTEARLAAARATGAALVLVNHWHLREDTLRLGRIPRFSLWCGTRRSEQWHLRFGASVVVFGHTHVPRTTWRDGVRFEEVSYGYPRERERWGQPHALSSYLRQILPAPVPGEP